MREKMLDRIVREAEADGWMAALGGKLSSSDLQSLLIEIARLRSAAISPAMLLRRYKEDRFVRLAAASPRDMADFDALAFALASPLFVPVELSPVCPLGTVSAVGTVSQNKVVATGRNSEVVSDLTNVMALECALRRSGGDIVRLCSSHRLLRAQGISGPISFAHFRVFGLCSAGRDTGSHGFEFGALLEHVGVHLRVLAKLRYMWPRVGSVRVFLTDLRGDLEGRLGGAVVEPLRAEFPDVAFGFDPDRTTARGYYKTVSLDIRLVDSSGEELSIGDGGFTDWTAKLLGNRKERLMISALGSERLCVLFGAHATRNS